MSKAGSEGWLGTFIHHKALQLVCSQADTPVRQEWLITMLLGTMSLNVLHCCTGCARGLHGGSSGLVMFCAEHVSRRTQIILIFLQVGVCASDLSRDAEGPPGLRPS